MPDRRLWSPRPMGVDKIVAPLKDGVYERIDVGLVAQRGELIDYAVVLAEPFVDALAFLHAGREAAELCVFELGSSWFIVLPPSTRPARQDGT